MPTRILFPSPDLFDGRMTDAPRPTYWLDGTADSCVSLGISSCFCSAHMFQILPSTSSFIAHLSVCMSLVCFLLSVSGSVNQTSKIHKPAKKTVFPSFHSVNISCNWLCKMKTSCNTFTHFPGKAHTHTHSWIRVYNWTSSEIVALKLRCQQGHRYLRSESSVQ